MLSNIKITPVCDEITPVGDEENHVVMGNVPVFLLGESQTGYQHRGDESVEGFQCGGSSWINLYQCPGEEDSVVAQFTTALVDAGLMARSTAALQNGLNFDEELLRMKQDALKMAKSVKEVVDTLTPMGIDEEVINQIVNHAYLQLHAEPTPASDPQDFNQGSSPEGDDQESPQRGQGEGA